MKYNVPSKMEQLMCRHEKRNCFSGVEGAVKKRSHYQKDVGVKKNTTT